MKTGEVNLVEVQAEQLARRFHEAYERLAPSMGYETRPATRTFDPSSTNGRLMIAVCRDVAAPVRGLPLTEVDWIAVGRILDAQQRLRGIHSIGTSNWGAAIWKAAHGIGTTAPGGDGEAK